MSEIIVKTFIDSNVWLYRLLIDPTMNLEEGQSKRKIAIGLTQASDRSIVISTQIIMEETDRLIREFCDELGIDAPL